MAGYVRQSSSNIQPGEIVKSGPVNNEFNAIRDAFNKTSGHKHDGSTAEGAFISTLADSDALNKIVIDTSNNRIGFFSEVSSAAVEQIRIQDGAIVPVTDNDIDLGTSSLEFKDLFIDGTATIDTLTVDESATITANLTVNGNTTLGNAASDTVTLTADVASAITPSADDTHDLGAVGSEWRNLYVDGQALIDDLVADTADINGGTIDGAVIGGNNAAAGTFSTLATTSFSLGGTAVTSTAAELNILDGVTSTATELNILDGVTASTAELNIMDGVTATTAELNIMDGVTSTAAELNILDGVTSTTAELNILDGVTSTAAELNKLDGATVTVSEINILDGDTSATSTTVADADRVVLNDNGTMVQVAVTDLAAYFDDEITAMPNLVTTAATTVGALNSGSITSGFGTIDTGSSTITTTGNITGGNLIISDGGNIGSSSDTDAISIASGGNVTMSQNLTVTGDLTVSGTTTTVNSTTVTIDDPVFTIGGDTAPSSDDNKDRGIEFRYHTGSAAKVGFFGFDDSTGKFTFIPDATNNSEVFSGTAGTIVANLEGAVTGNASTATALANARTIAGQSFDGTGNITIAPTDLTGVTATATELNILDGDTSATSTTIAAADRVILNDDGTMKQVSMNDVSTFLAGDLGVLTNVTSVGALDSGSITSNFGSINNGSSGITSSGTIQFGSLSDGTITVTAFVDEDDMTSNSATLIPTQQSVKAYVDSTAGQANNVTGLTATGTELNTVADASGVSIDTSTAVAANDALLLYDNSGSSIGYFDVDLLDTYFSATTKTLTNKTLTNPVVTGLKLDDAGLTIEGSSANNFETVLNVTDPTADRTITFPDATGTVAVSGQDITFGGNGSSGGVTLQDGRIDIRTGTGSVAAIRFYCEVSNAHYTELKSAAHSQYSGNLSFTLPASDGSNGQVLQTNGSGQLSFTSISTNLVDDTSPQLGGNLDVNGNNITSSADFTIDAGGDITLDAGGQNIRLKDDGTEFGQLLQDSNNFVLYSSVSDADMIFKGNDGGVITTVLTLDMSAAGTATFNAGANFGGSVDINGDLNAVDNIQLATALYHEGDTNTFLSFGSGGDSINLATGGSTRLTASNSGVTIGDITINGSTISDAGDLDFDIGGDLNIDVDGGDVRLKDGGTQFASLYKSGNNFGIYNPISDGDLLFQGKDGGSFFTALTVDMSNAGAATFNSSVVATYFSAPNYYINDSIIHNGDGNTYINFGTDTISLVTGGSAEVTVTPTGVQLGDTGNGYFQPVSGGYGSIQIDGGAHNSWEGYSIGGRAVFMHDNSNTTLLYDDVNDKRFLAGTHGGAVQLYHNGTSKIDTTSSGLNISGDLNAVDNVYVAGAVIHEGDTNTYMNFGTDTINLYAGGNAQWNIYSSYISGYAPIYNYTAYFEEAASLSGTTPTINAAASGVFYLTMSGNTTFTFTNTSSNWGVGFVLYLTGNGGTVTWPASVDWAGGTAPDAPGNGEVDILVFHTRDGSNWVGALAIDAAG